jgi:glycosyltransferase involved in cell wall biosynthesis
MISGPVFSVVVPAYRCQATIHSAIDSVLANDVSAEVVVVDDGSPDRLELHRSAAEGVRLLRRESNGGTAAARNDGIEHALGQWVAFLDADDSYEAHRLDRAHEFLHNSKLDGVMTDTVLLTETDVASTVRPLPDRSGLVRVRTPIVFASLVIRRAELRKAGPFDARWPLHEDADMWLRLIRGGARVGYLPTPVYRYRIHSGSKTQRARAAVGLKELRQICMRHAFRPGLRYDERLSLLMGAIRSARGQHRELVHG